MTTSLKQEPELILVTNELKIMLSEFMAILDKNVSAFPTNSNIVTSNSATDEVLEMALSSLERTNIHAAESIAEISVLKRDIDIAARKIDRSLAETDVILQRLTVNG